MNRSSRYFAPDYQTTRRRFRDAVVAGRGRLDSLPLSARGLSGEELAIDIGWFGAPHPRRVFVHSSGLHGVEGYAGSAIQLQWLEQGLPALREGDAIVLAHMLNPYGSAWLRRVNENNVDLNRNFGAAGTQDVEPNSEYLAFDALLNPPSPPRFDFFYAHAAWLIALHGMAKMRRTVISGQTVNARGLFYAGAKPEAGPAAYQRYLETHLARANRIVAIDVHTGLGRYGEDKLMVDAALSRAQLIARMHRVFADRIQQSDDSRTAYHSRGTQQEMYERLFPCAEVHFATQEFGTLGALRVVAALRAENRWHHHGTGAVDHPAKRRLLAAFCPRDERWREQVLRRGDDVIAQACELAFATGPAEKG
jgi:hypothetical protein